MILKARNKISLILLLFIALFACSDKSEPGNQEPQAQVDQQENTVHASQSRQSLDTLIGTCADCHGVDGVATNPEWPNLSAQQPEYLLQQMQAFRDGKRKDNIMLPSFLTGLDDEQLSKIAKYYNSQPGVRKSTAEADLNLAGQNVRANCISCHGMQGITVSESWPNLAGQNAKYLEKQLLAYRTGSRENIIMQTIANELSEQQIKDVTEYFSQVSID